MLWILNQADGSVGFIEIVEASGIDFETMSRALETLRREGLVELRAVD
jgi:aminopeptidase-like protein